MKVNIDKRVKKILYSFSETDRARINKVVELFTDKGFSLSEIYLKKLSKNIWELRPGRVRLLFGTIHGETIIVNIFVKKTTKAPLKEIRLAESRLVGYL
mgnify:CR=1 FL=1